MTTIKKTVRKKKRKVGRPSFSRKDIPEEFFRYYDAYRYGFWNKREFAEYLLVSRPTLDRYFNAIQAKEPVVSKAENNRLKIEMGVGNDLKELIAFYKILKEQHGEKGKSTGLYGNASQARFYLRMRTLQRRDGELTIASIYEALGNRVSKAPDNDE